MSPKNSQQGSRKEKLESYVRRFTTNWPLHNANKVNPPISSKAEEEIVFLTGSTGALGSQLLANLIARSRVVRIYAFNRPHPKRTSRERHEAVFIDKGNDLRLLDSPKVVLVEGDLSVLGFGVNKKLFEDVGFILSKSHGFNVTDGTFSQDEECSNDYNPQWCVIHTEGYCESIIEFLSKPGRSNLQSRWWTLKPIFEVLGV